MFYLFEPFLPDVIESSGHDREVMM